jgi:hypothetical protein
MLNKSLKKSAQLSEPASGGVPTTIVDKTRVAIIDLADENIKDFQESSSVIATSYVFLFEEYIIH